MTPFKVSESFSERPTFFDGVVEHEGWRLKHYTVLYHGRQKDPEQFAKGEALALASLPSPPVTEHRPGVGILIHHHGKGMDYVVLCWWDRENEFPIRLWVDEGEGWREGKQPESICVWDLSIIWAEREAYVTHVLEKANAPDITSYLTTIRLSEM